MYIIIQIYFVNKFKQFLQCIMKQNLIAKYSKLNKREKRIKTHPIDVYNMYICYRNIIIFVLTGYITLS